MKLTILGSSGSLGAPDNAASGYLIQMDNAPSILMDMGPGVLAQLERVQNPSDAHVVFSHLHADHCVDFPSLLVWRRYHPTAAAKGRNLCFGPTDTPIRMGRLSADSVDNIDDMSDTFAFTPWENAQEELVGAVSITPYSVIHPIETFALRVEHKRSGKVVAYSGDSSYTENLIDCARNADVFLCEATWGETSEGKAPNMHMSGAEAGRIARLAGVKRLVLVHIPPWGNAEAALEKARSEYDGPIDISYQGMEINI